MLFVGSEPWTITLVKLYYLNTEDVEYSKCLLVKSMEINLNSCFLLAPKIYNEDSSQ